MGLTAILADPVTRGIVVGALALILFGAAWHKWSDGSAFLSALSAYRLLPAPLLGPAARLIPALETALGIGLLIPVTRDAALVGAASLMGVYGVAIGINLGRGRSYIDCGCGDRAHPLSWALVVRNGVIAAAALGVAGASVDRPLGWLDVITLTCGVLGLLAAHLTADEVLRQASRMRRTGGPDIEASPFP